ncbi:pyridoxamine 5'-phosphate oxidase [Streptomyces sp. Je 1-79]|uniref:pyridoxamine 5'-phosphate oxidase n=1 Tax=Streptomyces sp. Je 1-79 TaxID=2943847 RepID=UPI0021A5B498|nr:pyridoxamine 5'-phosphate oxidase [Streptomyces sp. Je 1-79]MCT4352733.1 pyridoxamine 5'-phosphate oxidase [Streptomyces sp. Je 1-79]
MSDHEPPRPRTRRKQDVLTRLREDDDLWAATATAHDEPCLVPLSFLWDVHDGHLDRGTLLLCTKRNNPTARNLTPRGEVRLSLGHTRDVVLIDGTAEAVEGTDLPTASADAFAAKLAWDPRDRAAWIYLRVTPRSVKAWREENELADRELMRDGEWLV